MAAAADHRPEEVSLPVGRDNGKSDGKAARAGATARRPGRRTDGQAEEGKRMLRMIATLVEAAACWPGGTWQLKGEAPGHAGWTATTTAYGLAVVTNGATSGQTFMGN